MTFNGAVERIAKARSESEDWLWIVSFTILSREWAIRLVYRIYKFSRYWHIYIALIKLFYRILLRYWACLISIGLSYIQIFKILKIFITWVPFCIKIIVFFTIRNMYIHICIHIYILFHLFCGILYNLVYRIYRPSRFWHKTTFSLYEFFFATSLSYFLHINSNIYIQKFKYIRKCLPIRIKYHITS